METNHVAISIQNNNRIDILPLITFIRRSNVITTFQAFIQPRQRREDHRRGRFTVPRFLGADGQGAPRRAARDSTAAAAADS